MVVCGRLRSFTVVFVVVFVVVCGRLRSFVVVCGRFCGHLRSFAAILSRFKSLFGYFRSFAVVNSAI